MCQSYWRKYVLSSPIKQVWGIVSLLLLLTFNTPIAVLSNGQATNIYVPIGANDGPYQGRHSAYTVGIQFLNLEADPATLGLTAYTASGDMAGSGTYQVQANQMLTLFPISAVATGFTGSFLLASDKNGAAIANLVSSDFSGGAAYVSQRSGAATVFLPLLNASSDSNSGTWFSVQNTSAAEAEIQVSYSDGITKTATIKAGASHTFYQNAEAHFHRVFAGTITSTQSIVATAVQEAGQVIFAYNGFSTVGATDLVFPLINVGSSGYITGIQIQNTGTQATEVTVSYIPSSTGTACSEKRTVAASDSATFALYAFFGQQGDNAANCNKGNHFIGSAQVTGNSNNQPLVGIVNQFLPGKNGEAYTAFAPKEATSTVILPLIMDRNGGFFTGFSVMNVGTTTTDINCTFTNTNYKVTGTLAPGQALADLQMNKIAERYVGSATCIASGENAKIVAIINELGTDGSKDQLLVYEGINQ